MASLTGCALLAALSLAGPACALDATGDDQAGTDASVEEPEADAQDEFERTPKPNTAPTEFDMHNLLEDDMIFGGEHITVEEVQDFLTMKGSFLAGYNDPNTNDSAATIIVERAHAYGVNPLYIIARIQTESALIGSGASSNLEKATGCGCPDSAPCNPELGGFGNQIECAAEKMKAYSDEIDASGATRSGWRIGTAKETSNPCSVTPANRATALLYTYTPWVGAYAEQCGTSLWGGSSLVALSYYKYWVEYPWSI